MFVHILLHYTRFDQEITKIIESYHSIIPGHDRTV